MKIKPIVLCGGSGSRLNLEKNRNLPKQFIDFGGWTLFEKTLNVFLMKKCFFPMKTCVFL